MLRYFLVMLLLVACDPNKTQVNAEQAMADRPAIAVTPQELTAAFDENEVAANQRYKGAVVEIVGAIDRIRTDAITDMPVVVLKSSDFMGVDLKFAKGHENEIAHLRKDQRVTARCICDGKMMGVNLIGCQLR